MMWFTLGILIGMYIGYKMGYYDKKCDDSSASKANIIIGTISNKEK